MLAASAMANAEDARFFRLVGPAQTAILGVTWDGYLTWTNAMTNVTCTVQTAQSLPNASNWGDYVQIPVSNHVIIHRLFDPNPPTGMVFIPAGSFTMGNSMDPNEGQFGQYELPVHTVYVSALYMDRFEVTKALWDEVYQWATNQGYSFEHEAQGKANNHPAHSMTWYDAVKWCNARSEKEGRVPAYYTNAAQTAVYRSGRVNVRNDCVMWNAGYRLPTEAEWEKAARGGVTRRRFAWSNTDDITHSWANYYSIPNYPYDTSLTRGYHPAFNDGVTPYTSPVGYFAANGYGVHDMTGNVWEWCWDWCGYYSSAPQSDPRGPDSCEYRVIRGGAWSGNASLCRAAMRFNFWMNNVWNDTGFRCALPPSS